MQTAAPSNLRTTERFLLAPPVAGRFGAVAVSVCDISMNGARIRHELPLDTGGKALLRMQLDGRSEPVSLEGVVVWTQSDAVAPFRYVSGIRTYCGAEVFEALLARLRSSHRTTRIEELRLTDRFILAPQQPGTFAGHAVQIENLSARGAGIESRANLGGVSGELRFASSEASLDIVVPARVVWSGVKAVGAAGTTSYRAGLAISEKIELMRLGIGQLSHHGRATLDTQSLRLKVKILRARARQLAPSYGSIEASGIPAEQYLLVQGVRAELVQNPEEAIHWYRRARTVIADPMTRTIAPPIADHPDALAVWEYLDRSIDPTIIGRAFELPRG